MKTREGNCTTCGEPFTNFPGDNYMHIPFIASGGCFLCYHWDQVLNQSEKYTSVRTDNGDHFAFITSQPISTEANHLLGHGGRKFKITFNDGTEIITNNLWCQGTMPKHWISKYPPNAKVESNIGGPK